jgi:hypothetical protein
VRKLLRVTRFNGIVERTETPTSVANPNDWHEREGSALTVIFINAFVVMFVMHP